MGNEMQVFQFDGSAQVRVQNDEHGEPMFCLADVCVALGIANPRNVVSRMSPGGVRTVDTPTTSGVQPITFISESNMYRVIFQSRKPEAERFTDWVTGEVLPTIRKSGGYMAAKDDDTPESIMARAVLIAQETIDRQKKQLQDAQNRIEEQNRQIAEAAPKVLFAETFAVSKGKILIRDFAKMISQSFNVPFGQNSLYNWLKSHGYMNNNRYPSDYAEKMQLLHVTEGYHQFSDGSFGQHHTTRITCKGQTYFFNKIKEQIEKYGRII